MGAIGSASNSNNGWKVKLTVYEDSINAGANTSSMRCEVDLTLKYQTNTCKFTAYLYIDSRLYVISEAVELTGASGVYTLPLGPYNIAHDAAGNLTSNIKVTLQMQHAVDGNFSISAGKDFTFTHIPRPYKLSITTNDEIELTVNRTATPESGVELGEVMNGATVYYNDVLEFWYTPADGKVARTATINGVAFASGISRVVTGNVTVVCLGGPPGYVKIDTGSGFETYQVYIDNGGEWIEYIPHIDNGSSWDMCTP